MRRSVQILVAALVLFVSTSPVMATVEFNDGQTHNINYQINDDVLVDLGTIVNLVTGGNIGLLRVRDGGRLNVSGGIVRNSLSAWGNSLVTVTGGNIDGHLQACGASTVLYSGGQVQNDFEMWGYGRLIVSGSNFAIDGNPVVFGEYSCPGANCDGLLTGQLASGELFANEFWIHGRLSKLILVPEPTTLFLLGLGGLALLRNRRSRLSEIEEYKQ